MSTEIAPRPADQAAIDHYRRSFNMLGAEIVDLDMNVLAVFDRDGVYSFRANGMAAYIKHASGLMTTCGTESWCEFRLSCAAISPFIQMVFQRMMEATLPGNTVSFTVDMFDKDYSCMSSVEERKNDKIRAHIGRCTMSVYGTQAECKAARDALERLLDDEA